MKRHSLSRKALHDHPLPSVIDGDKETKGRILVIAGSREVPGAALLAAMSAMRAGAGKLRIVTVESVSAQLGIVMPESMVLGMAEAREGGFAADVVDAIVEQTSKVDAVVAGPGMSQGDVCARIAKGLLASRAALALDAALLHAMKPFSSDRTTAPILLPHAGELAALLDCTEREIAADPLGCGLEASRRYRSVVLVKGVTSHVVTPRGEAWTYSGGAPGLGVSGSGDVLAGIVGGLLARGAEPLSALLWGVWLHGAAGALLARKMGPIGFLARELPDEVPGLLARG